MHVASRRLSRRLGLTRSSGSSPACAALARRHRARWRWAELRKLRHDNLDIVTRSVQPLLWLFIFGTALRHNRVARRRLPRLPRLPRAGRHGAGRALHRDLLRPRRDLGARRRPVAAAARHAAAAARDRARQGRGRVHPGAHPGDRAARRARDRRHRRSAGASLGVVGALVAARARAPPASRACR